MLDIPMFSVIDRRRETFTPAAARFRGDRQLQAPDVVSDLKIRDRRALAERLRLAQRTSRLYCWRARAPFTGEGLDCPALDTLFLAAPVSCRMFASPP
ncbi:hypothetical protein ACFQZZ_15240 [Nocardia sp. GCM10030253]|uniref:hypothetical protein n=1 Tax=Nocardia sp. GCM10030253 TaxID=3273404 RepID=UPI003627BEE0